MSNDVTRTHKDTLFQMAFKDDPEAALSLYNAVNDSHYTDVSKLKYELLESGLFLRMENDNGFILDQSLNVYEHQSSMNLNMPLRGLFYFADLYRKIIPAHKRLYQHSLIRIPVPKYVVFYNGTANMGGDRSVLRLSDAFEREDESHGFEWTATMININKGHNEAIMERCKVLKDYSYFVDLVREYGRMMPAREAVMKAIEECIEKGIFREVLERYKEEIENMSWDEFNEEDYAEFIREETRAEEREKLEREKKRADAEKDRADAEKDRADAAEERADAAEQMLIQALIETIQEFGGAKEQAEKKLAEKHPEYKDRAKQLVEQFWK